MTTSGMVNVRYSNLPEMFEHKAAEYANNTFLSFYDRDISFHHFDKLVNRFAHALLRMGIGKGDIVCVYADNSPETLIAHFGIIKTGATSGPINCWWQPPEIKYLLNDSQAAAAVVGVPDKIMGEEVKAFIVLKVPRYVEFIDELPKNIIGKTLKKRLKQRH